LKKKHQTGINEKIAKQISPSGGKRNNSPGTIILDRVAGIWKNRDDLPDFEKLRKEWDRGFTQ
jgi:hypothetical protein